NRCQIWRRLDGFGFEIFFHAVHERWRRRHDRFWRRWRRRGRGRLRRRNHHRRERGRRGVANTAAERRVNQVGRNHVEQLGVIRLGPWREKGRTENQNQ